MLCHLAGLAGYVIPFGNIFGPLLIWLIKKEESALVDAHGKESLNFQISMSIYFLAGIVLMLTIIGLFIGLALIGLTMMAQIVFTITAAVKVTNNEEFSYPFTIRFIS